MISQRMKSNPDMYGNTCVCGLILNRSFPCRVYFKRAEVLKVLKTVLITAPRSSGHVLILVQRVLVTTILVQRVLDHRDPHLLGPPLRPDPQSYSALSDYLLSSSYQATLSFQRGFGPSMHSDDTATVKREPRGYGHSTVSGLQLPICALNLSRDSATAASPRSSRAPSACSDAALSPRRSSLHQQPCLCLSHQLASSRW